MAEEDDHIVVVHAKCRKNYRDFYVADIVLGLLRHGRKVTVCTTEMNDVSPVMNVEDNNNKLEFLTPWDFLPDSLYGHFEEFFFQLKLMSLVLSIIFTPLEPCPDVIITDMTPIAVSLLKVFTSCKVLYLKHFTNLYSGDSFFAPRTLFPSKTLAGSLADADEIIVQTESLKNMLHRSIPRINNTITVLTPCYDTGCWLHEARNIDVRNIVPMLPIENFMFVVFTEFKSRSNLRLVLEAMDYIVHFTEITFSLKVHLVIAGYAQPLSDEEDFYYARLQEMASTEVYCDNVTILKQTSITEQKVLIKHCTAVVNPTHHNVFPGSILMAMNMKKPILSVDNGFAGLTLVDKVTGFLLYHHPCMFGTKMEELAKHPKMAEEIVENAKCEFDQNYSFHAYSRLLNQIVDRHVT